MRRRRTLRFWLLVVILTLIALAASGAVYLHAACNPLGLGTGGGMPAGTGCVNAAAE